MADDQKKKIIDLPVALSVSGGDIVVAVQNGVDTKQATIEQIGTNVNTSQTFSDLNTTSKNVVGAINEILQGMGASTLDGLSDVTITSATLANGQVLKYDAMLQKWVNADPGGGSLESLSDVTITALSLSDGQFLVYDDVSDKWVNKEVVHEPITQAQYDAMVQAGTVDPDVYYPITDASIKTSDLENDSGFTSSTVIAEAYNSTSTYAVGDYVTHENNLYKCNTAIETAEEWNAEHWTLVDVISAIPTKTSELDNDSGFAEIDDNSTANDKAWSASKISDEIGKVSTALDYVEETFACAKKEIPDVTISASGVIEATASHTKLVCFMVKEGTEINVGGTYDLYAFFTQEPALTRVSYNSSRTISSSISSLKVPNGCKWIAIRTTSSNVALNPNTIDYLSTSLNKYNSVELLSGVSLSNKTTANISITWSGRTATITGTPTTTAESFANYYNITSELPVGFIAGGTIYFEVKTSNKNARLGFIPYDSNGNALSGSYFTENGVYTIPSNAVGIVVRLALVTNKTFSNDTFTAYIYNAPSNLTIEDLLNRMSLAELRIGKETKAPMLTIIDDDGNEKFYTDLYPLATSKKVSISSAIPYSWIGTAGELTLSQVQEIYANGVEILNHSYAHDINYDTWTERDFEEDYRKAKNSFNSIGIPTNIIMYVGSTSLKSEAVEAAKNVFIGGITSGSEHINYCTGDKYQIERYGITDSNNDGRINGLVLSQLTDLIDTLKTNGGWMIWMLHTSGAYWNNTMLTNISSAIDYAISEGVPIVSAECGFRKYYGN